MTFPVDGYRENYCKFALTPVSLILSMVVSYKQLERSGNACGRVLNVYTLLIIICERTER